MSWKKFDISCKSFTSPSKSSVLPCCPRSAKVFCRPPIIGFCNAARASISGSKSMRDGRVGIEHVSKTAITLDRQVSWRTSACAMHHPDSLGTPKMTVVASEPNPVNLTCMLIRSTCLAGGPPVDIVMGSSRTSNAFWARSVSSKRSIGISSSDPSRSTGLLVSRCWNKTLRIWSV